MHQDQIKALFDQQAAGYDIQWAKTAPIRHCLHLLLASFFAELPKDARILCVGVGTGAELAFLAQQHPHWSFTVVEPSGGMLDVCRQRTEKEGFASRCIFHAGYLESLPVSAPHNAATCFLVSQFILDQRTRSEFFRAIASRLEPGGLLASSDLAAELNSPEYEVLFPAWMNIMSADSSRESANRMRQTYAQDVGVLAPNQIALIIEAGGFQSSIQFFQAGLIHAWISRRT
ncbi:MAG: class I SAM-dependent methyltransferase [Steroidobacteraceae bacterium]